MEKKTSIHGAFGMIVYFAGMERSSNLYDIRPKTDDNIFCTYFYQKDTDQFLEKSGKQMGHKGIITIDSGAHTFFGYAGTSTAAHHNNKDISKMPDPEKYFRGYLEWIKKNYSKISYYVELDIGAIVGQKKVNEWREILRKEKVFDKCIMVMHSRGMDWDDFYEMIEITESGYIGFEGLRAKQIHLPYMKMLKATKEKGIKVHGFALTAKEVTTNYPFYSVDSTTWTVPIRYGSFLVLDNGSMKQVEPTKANYLKYRIPPELHSTNRSKESAIKKLYHSMETQREYERYLTKLWQARGIEWN